MNVRALVVLLALFIGATTMTSAESITATVTSSGDTALATGVAPGIAVAVIHDGKIVAAQGFGYANIATKVAVTPETRFAIGSMTKQFTAAAIMLLVHDGKLRLDDTLATYVPTLPNAKTITLRMLLNHTSGLHNYPSLSEHLWPLNGSIATSTILSLLASDHPDFAPGTKWVYSNANYAALAAVIEKVSGESYSTFLQRRIFSPLGMSQSGFGFRAQTNAPISVGYKNGQPEIPALSLDLYSGAGGIVSSADDLARWDIALTSKTLLGKADVETMWTPGALSNGTPIPYAMGWIPTRIAGHREIWHNGLAPDAGGYCYNAVFPDDHVAVVVLTNGLGAMGIPERIVAQVAASFGIGQPPAAPTTPQTAPG
ncbi:MAG: serine hydrolase domain-containing protein, partial [Vulcanimicrobiaceae bacterium]